MEEQMYHNAEILLPRKKKVWEAFHSNTFRIFDETLPERLDPLRVYQNHRRPVMDPKESRSAPQPHSSGFIRTNVRLLNQPIAYMRTKRTEQSDWWSDSREEAEPVTPAYSRASTQRSDFQPIRDTPVREPQTSRAAARGIIPALSSLDRSENLTDQRPE
ncbi:uncharacterized protein C2orf73 homolog isoform X1 [Pseudorasbora parva]|uniref:uncharacterized protein C2orf73 homolog isoform X1 n=1 Tax=Pseudorasbora parva TaxID=51549 RepID=UPI00351F1775